MEMHTLRDRRRRTVFDLAPGAVTAAAAMLLAANSHAAIFRCVDANGANTYSDKPCTSPEPSASVQSATMAKHGADKVAATVPVDSSQEVKASKILQALQLTSAPGTEGARAQRTINLIAPDLVKQLDPANPAWTPQHPKWYVVLEFVKSDLRKDVASALRASTLQTNQAVAHEYALHAKESDMDAMLLYLSSSEGARYITFQNELKSISNQALDSLMAQEPITEDEPTEIVLKRRQQLLALGFDSRFATDGGGPALGPSAPGSAAILKNTARREGTALDTLYSEYEGYLPAIATFNQSATAKHFFVSAEPALRTNMDLLSEIGATFASTEFTNYEQRWRAYYGPPVRSSARSVTVMRAGSTSVVSSRSVSYNGGQMTRETAALQCEQRETAAYGRVHHFAADGNYQAGLKTIQNTCRSEQNLPPL
jgi:hypothetical protein